MARCERCRVNALKEQLLAEFPDGDIPDERARPLYTSCYICSHGCLRASGESACENYTARTKTLPRRIAALEKAVSAAASDAARRPDLYAHALAKKRAELKEARDALAESAEKCRRCSRSADDNPQNNGVTFVSFDAGGDASSSGQQPDGNTSLRGWMEGKRLVAPSDTSPSPRVTRLPAEFEDRLRIELANYSDSLSLVDKMLVAVLMTRKAGGRTNERYSLIDFAKLRWMFRIDAAGRRHHTDFSRFLVSCGWTPPPDGKCGVSRQTIGLRFKNAVRKLPILTAVAHGQIGKGSSDMPTFDEVVPSAGGSPAAPSAPGVSRTPAARRPRRPLRRAPEQDDSVQGWLF